MRFIVTGTGRCGTGYMSQVARKSGFPCGHENVFTAEGPAPCTLPADSSWMAVPYLRRHPNVPIFLVHRHPAAVVSSFLGIQFFEKPSVYRDFLFAQNPALRHLDSFNAACAHYYDWNKKALEHADVVSDIENINWDAITDLAHLNKTLVEEALDQVPLTYNHKQRANIDPSKLPGYVWEMQAELQEKNT